MLQPRFVEINEKKLIGAFMEMSFADYQVGQLFGGFMPRKSEIANKINNDLLSLVIYRADHFQHFNPTNLFTRWAAVEVSNFDNVPQGMSSLTLPAGLYAVFDYKGSSQNTTIFQWIYTTWLTSSDYYLDDRPHFEVLGKNYRNNDPTSEEEIWVPVKAK